MKSSSIALLAFLATQVSAFPVRRTSMRSADTAIHLRESSAGGGSFLSSDDFARLQDMRDRHTTLPILILDSILPGQTLDFGSSDEQFRNLCNFILETGDDLIVVGRHPTTREPLSIGVTVSINRRYENGDFLRLQGKGEERLEVQGEPHLDPSGNFFLADVEIVSQKKESPMDTNDTREANRLSDELNQMIEEWIVIVIGKGKGTEQQMIDIIDELGPFPLDTDARSMWVASILNPPTPSDWNLSIDIRPAMLACQTPLQRMHLAHTALEASIHHLSGKKGIP